MSGLSRACALVALAGAGACLDIPPYRPCGAGDRDCDGWPALAGNGGANDCDDDNADVNPGREDDPATPVVEDCFPTAVMGGLAPVTATPVGWRVDTLRLDFDSASRMPSSLRLGATELLGGNTDGCVRDERFLGVSLYPAFAVDNRSSQVGQTETLRGGPAQATTRVTWSQAVPAAATGFGCDVATTVTGTVDFTVQANGRIVRRDQVVVSTGVTSCAGCGDMDGNPPIFTSYATFIPALDRYQVEPQVSSMPFPAAGVATDLAAPSAPVIGCVSGASAASPQVGLAWRVPGPIAGMRARTTGDGRVNHAMVVDWVAGGALGAGTYELVTAIAAEADGSVDCSVALRTRMAEFARPPTLTDTTFIADRGVYRYTGPEQVGVVIAASQGVEGGAVLEVPNASERGVTVWRSSGDRYVRLRRGLDYLLQLEPVEGASPTAVVYLPTIPGGSTLVVAGPGGEPPP